MIPKNLTVAELERLSYVEDITEYLRDPDWIFKILQSFYDFGYNQGYIQGQEKGYDEGYEGGHSEAYYEMKDIL